MSFLHKHFWHLGEGFWIYAISASLNAQISIDIGFYLKTRLLLDTEFLILWYGEKMKMSQNGVASFLHQTIGITQTSPMVVIEKIKAPAHMVEGDHLRKRPQPQPTLLIETDWCVWVAG